MRVVSGSDGVTATTGERISDARARAPIHRRFLYEYDYRAALKPHPHRSRTAITTPSPADSSLTLVIPRANCDRTTRTRSPRRPPSARHPDSQ
ncbi:hypothetical protein [Haladaptatus sp. DYF46]|uniref:hypothetical protein n=1 Tax=Haladaptatus sp. DYF46 TaxID=2886041 RepID=UPI001E354987|nr:hypothetical protein [Haladaptatus sp. DYF46]